MLKRGSSATSPRPPEASNGLPNGVLSTASDGSSCEDTRRNFPKDVADFGSSQKHQRGGNEQSDVGEIPREMYPLPEESGLSDAEAEDREQEAKAGERLPERQTAADKELGQTADGIADEGGTEKTGESLPCSD